MNRGQPWRAVDILKTSVMISTVMCRRETLHNTQVHSHIRSPVRIEPRRNSIPPTQAVTAKHLLAYLPRPQPESRPNTHKVQLVIYCLYYTKHVSVVVLLLFYHLEPEVIKQSFIERFYLKRVETQVFI